MTKKEVIQLADDIFAALGTAADEEQIVIAAIE